MDGRLDLFGNLFPFLLILLISSYLISLTHRTFPHSINTSNQYTQSTPPLNPLSQPYPLSQVYGRRRTFKAKKAEVIHHVKHHGQRYEVDRTNEHRVGSLVKAGRQKIHQWMVKQNVPLWEIKVSIHSE